MSAGVHRDRAADRAGNAHRPLETHDALVRESTRHERQIQSGTRVNDHLVLIVGVQRRARTIEVHDQHVAFAIFDEQIRSVAQRDEVEFCLQHRGAELLEFDPRGDGHKCLAVPPTRYVVREPNGA